MAITPRVDLETRYKKVFNKRTGVVGTQFTKNKFGKDISGMEGGPGYSGQPFIKRFPIPGADDRPSGEYFDLATQALKIAQPELHRGVSKGVLVKNTAARKISRLSKNIKALSA